MGVGLQVLGMLAMLMLLLFPWPAYFPAAGVCLVVSSVAHGTAQRALVVAARFGLAAAFASLHLHTSGEAWVEGRVPLALPACAHIPLSVNLMAPNRMLSPSSPPAPCRRAIPHRVA